MEEKNNYTYEAAFNELQEIVQQIELGEVDIDQLSDQIKRAAILVKICEAKLSETEEEVQILLQKLHEEDAEEDTEGEVEEENEEYENLDEGDEMNNSDENTEQIEENESEEAEENDI